MALHRRRHRQKGLDDGNRSKSATKKVEENEGDRRLFDDEGREQKDDAPSPSATSFAPAAESAAPLKKATQSFHVTKFVILRLVGFVYFIAFLGAYNQNRGLMGSNGLVPARNYMDQLKQKYDSPMAGFLKHPSLYWFIDSSLEDSHLDVTAVIGLLVSFAVVLGFNSWLAMTVLWLLDFSIVTAAEGTSFYAYGWESQLLETGFLSIWLCDLPTFRKNNIKGLFWDVAPTSPPSLPVLWLFRWLCARISIGAGLIKLRGGECWQKKTCLYYHFETQPIPSPMSFMFHFLPKAVLRRAVDLDYFVQLYSIWMVLLPGINLFMTNLRRMGGFIQAGFMINIILSGNFAFLNHVTIIPALACLDDNCYPHWIKKYVYRSRQIGSLDQVDLSNRSKITRSFIDLCLITLIGMLSVPVVTNLLQIGGKHQVMNASFSSFKLVNTYGAFGSVGEARYEPIISVSNDGNTWVELELPCKPGNIKRRPCFCAPYHYRLDWNTWFIGFKPHQSMLQRREQWMFTLIDKILRADKKESSERPWLALLDPVSVDLLQHGSMKYAKVDMYRYEMKDPLWIIVRKWLGGEVVTWWTREYEEPLIRPVQMHNSNLAYANI
mmetsp:Transcript_501/g.1004  ORF Transcript_501/g.1004 Transcript_501/m.1004 type:complete len:607 (-) Transcript_501:110-1930(-)|eukprot:CAMPEP_0183733710 /NCGR_PEP_ID=MMETSP0737-20130205/41815_1 /TAXON_ID=385413 /ORGANISM="Thalassiosira miniscula, Strain CCMP1093" /LENGTH=606 /DNA_ID=CAMNT_0025967017 /DNA_START=108 /DNA_END=1928 /DNA_ORIENTATION=-